LAPINAERINSHFIPLQYFYLIQFVKAKKFPCQFVTVKLNSSSH